MKTVYVADVGDGACIAIDTLFGQGIQIDCGRLGSGEPAYRGMERIHDSLGAPDIFILSHFHHDHYNGLLHALGKIPSAPFGRIKRAYYPRIPEFPRKEEFMSCLFAMNRIVLGSRTGLMEADFMDAMLALSGRARVFFKALSKGDTVNVAGSVFEVLWPPRRLTGKRVAAKIRRAVEDFKRAREEDETTDRIFEIVVEDQDIYKYLQEDFGRNHLSRRGREFDGPEFGRRELPDVVKKANRSLRDAANYFSLGLVEDNRLLFLGDAEPFGIIRIMRDLTSKQRFNFHILITPHHGTHWQNNLHKLKCNHSISSNGKERSPDFNQNYKSISEMSYSTWANGDIILGSAPFGTY